MKKKLIIVISSITVVVLMSGIAFFLWRDNYRPQADAKKIVTDFLTAYQNKDAAAGGYLSSAVYGDTTMEYNGFQGLIAEKLTYKIMDSHMDKDEDNCVWVDIEIETTDMVALLSPWESITDETDPAGILASLYASASGDAPKKTFSVSVAVKQYPTGMKIHMNGDLSDALFGGYNKYVFSRELEDRTRYRKKSLAMEANATAFEIIAG